MPAGKRRELVTFQRRALDAHGERLGAWGVAEGDEIEILADVTWLRGGEVVLEQRLQGRQPAAFLVAQNAATLGISSGWRVLIPRLGGETYDVQSRDLVGRRAVNVLAVADGQGGGV